MSVATSPVVPVTGGIPSLPTEPIWRLSVDRYHEMIRSGVLTEDDPIELLEGWLVTKMPKHPEHRAAIKLMVKALERAVPVCWEADTQQPITTEDSEPEPDGMVYRGNTLQYLDRHPAPQDLAMVAEVADTSLKRDRTTKKRIYARARIPVYWIINLVDRQVEVYTQPSGPAENPDYGQRQDYRPSESVPLVIDGVEVGRIAVDELLP